MTLIQLIILLVVLGLVWWLVSAYLPIPQPFKNIILIVFVLIAILVLLSFAGLLNVTLR